MVPPNDRGGIGFHPAGFIVGAGSAIYLALGMESALTGAAIGAVWGIIFGLILGRFTKEPH